MAVSFSLKKSLKLKLRADGMNTVHICVHIWEKICCKCVHIVWTSYLSVHTYEQKPYAHIWTRRDHTYERYKFISCEHSVQTIWSLFKFMFICTVFIFASYLLHMPICHHIIWLEFTRYEHFVTNRQIFGSVHICSYALCHMRMKGVHTIWTFCSYDRYDVAYEHMNTK